MCSFFCILGKVRGLPRRVVATYVSCLVCEGLLEREGGAEFHNVCR